MARVVLVQQRGRGRKWVHGFGGVSVVSFFMQVVGCCNIVGTMMNGDIRVLTTLMGLQS